MRAGWFILPSALISLILIILAVMKLAELPALVSIALGAALILFFGLIARWGAGVDPGADSRDDD